MTERIYRAQVLLEPEQRRRLEALARQVGKSISAVTRQVIDAGLDALDSRAEIWKKRARILEGFRILKEKQPFDYPGDLVKEARQEQEEEVDRIWRGES